ncbi:MAG: prepilin-type N-terminal cleavage/methylation domain-containing protein [Marinospirillum sp.]|uniref:PilW family protein n=1 Tax=Marinospirillum sp. TaxID=2183934 RepID=UPI0019F6D058|nr:prepilin-type N-terminal cleavage/methylation domain-containing protein [Marinospirillum sp.]MBE0505726.1 prepilin-type N-terminal cleavage/methylation domain-containing protein [Marinospirillum sp.]
MSNNRQQGFTLIELLVALAIGALLLMGIASSIAAITQAQNLTRDYEQVQETLRFTTSLISRSLRTAEVLANDTANNATTTNNQLSVKRMGAAGRLSCIGEEPSEGVEFFETYYQPAGTNHLACRVGATTEIIAYDISSFELKCLIYHHVDQQMLAHYEDCAGATHAEVIAVRVKLAFDATEFRRLEGYSDHVFTATLRSRLRERATQ